MTRQIVKQMAADGSFPLELARTKPYGYSIFNLDVMTGLAVVLSTPRENAMTLALPDGRSMVRGVEFLAPFLADKSAWKRPPDVLHWKEWPVRQPALLFGAVGSSLGLAPVFWSVGVCLAASGYLTRRGPRG